MIDRLEIVIKGKNPEYFLDKIIKKNINIYKITKKNRYIFIIIDKKDYDKLKKIKTSYKIEITKRYGISKIKYLFNKYMYFILAFLLGILINIFLSNIIFSVDVIHTNKNIRDIIKYDLEEEGIKRFHFKKSYQEKEKIVKKILKKETNDIEWLEIEDIGTKYVVKVEQRKKNKKEKQCSNRSIVAKKDAMILSIEAEEGEVVKKKLDYVKKGDVIISGLIYNKEDIVSKRCARGKVYGEIWYKVNLELPKKYYEEKVTGKTKKQIDIRFLNKRYTLFNKFKTYKRKSTNLLKSKILPISIDYSQYLETKVIRDNYTLQNVDKKATLLATSKLNDKLNNKDVIINKKVLKKYEKDSKILVEVFFKVKEDITDTISIDNINIDDENVKDKEQWYFVRRSF